MSKLSKHRVPLTLIIVLLLFSCATVAIFWARGFVPDFANRSFKRTGLIVISSNPTGANVYLDDRLTAATDANISFLAPKKYKVRIEKEGFAKWEKEVEIKADLAYEIKALLFPTAPEIKPETTTGAANPTLSPDSSRIAYGVSGETGGLYILPMSDRPFPFRQSARIVTKNQTGYDFSKAKFLWSPDSKELIAYFTDETGKVTANLQIDTDKNNEPLKDVSGQLLSIITSWQEQINTRSQTLSLSVPEAVREATDGAKLTSPSPSPLAKATAKNKQTQTAETTKSAANLINYNPSGLVFSPDEEKVFYKDANGKYQVYDLKEKQNYSLGDFQNLANIAWYPDSNHLVVAENLSDGGIISVIEADGNNKMVVYRGKYENSFVFAHPSGTRLIILSTLYQSENTPPNLYSIVLR